MKCEICGSQLPEGSTHCASCGQPTRHKREFDSVKKHWDAVGMELKRYGSKRDSAEASVRERYRQNRSGRRWLAIILAVALVICGFTVAKQPLVSGVTYLNGWWAMEQGDYDRAASLFSQVDGDFLDTRERLAQCEEAQLRACYDMAMEDYRQGNYAGAISLFRALRDYSDAADYAARCAERILEALPAAQYHWSFDGDLSEENGTASEPRGDAAVKGVVDSRLSKAAAFDGSGDYVTGGNGANVTEDWTLELVLVPTSGEDMVVLAKMDWKTGECPYRVLLCGGCLVWELTTADGEIISLQSSSQLLPGEKWYHIVLAKEEMDYSMYIDGVWQDGMVVPGEILQGEQILTIGDQTHRDEGETISGFRGFIADVAIYESALGSIEALLRYETMEALCIRRWDTSYYALPEEAERDNFVIYQSGANDRTEVLVFDIPEQKADHLTWDSDRGCFVVEPGGLSENITVYYLEGEEWVLYDSGMTELFAAPSEIISSNLDIWLNEEECLPSVLIGGRG